MCGNLGEYTDVVAMPLNGKVQDIDRCIHTVVAALNAGGVKTVWCCCGHGTQPGKVALEDGRMLTVTYGGTHTGEPEYIADPDLYPSCNVTEPYRVAWQQEREALVKAEARIRDLEKCIIDMDDARRKPKPLAPSVRALLEAANAAEIRTGMGGRPCVPFFTGPSEAALANAILAWRLEGLDKIGGFNEPR